MVTDTRPFPYRWTFYIGKDSKIIKIDKAVIAHADGANVAKTLRELGVETKAEAPESSPNGEPGVKED